MSKVLVVATSRKTRGGITSVIKAHATGKQWKQFHCHWVQTHRDGNSLRKLGYLLLALIDFCCRLPFYDIVHIHVATTQSAKRKRIFLKLAKWSHKKTILHFHPSNEKFLFEPANQKLYTELFSSADLVLVLSEQWRRWIKEALGLYKNIQVLYNPCPIVNRREDLRKPYILFAGTIIPRKGYEILLRGFAKVASQYPDWKVIFAGNGEINNGQRIARELGIDSQVEFVGWVQGAQKEKLFQESSIYCLASEGEGFPMGVLDAWAYGIPCVMTPVGGIPDLVEDGRNGLLFPIGDYNTLAEKLALLMGNNQLRTSIVTETDKLVNGELSVDVITCRLGQIYSSLSATC